MSSAAARLERRGLNVIEVTGALAGLLAGVPEGDGS